MLDRISQRVMLNFPDQRHPLRDGSTFSFQSQINQHAFRTGPMQRLSNFTPI
jgi:hypothetical protein